MLQDEMTKNYVKEFLLVLPQSSAVRHVAYIKRSLFYRKRWRIKCHRCKRLDLGPFFSYEFAEVRAYDESHRHARACSRRREKDQP